MRKQNSVRLIQMVQLAILAALVVLLQLLGGFIHIGPTSVSLVLIPIALGGMLFGPAAGALLGFVFGFITLMAGVTGTDPFTSILFNAQPFATSFICLFKATAAGFMGGLIYKLLKKINLWLATFAAAAIVPVTNTGLFILLGLIMVRKTLETNFVDENGIVYFLVIVCAGFNFLAEFGLNLILTPALFRLTQLLNRSLVSRQKSGKAAPSDTPDDTASSGDSGDTSNE